MSRTSTRTRQPYSNKTPTPTPAQQHQHPPAAVPMKAHLLRSRASSVQIEAVGVRHDFVFQAVQDEGRTGGLGHFFLPHRPTSKENTKELAFDDKSRKKKKQRNNRRNPEQ